MNELIEIGNLQNKTILFLGATIYFYDACIYAKSKGATVIALDYYDSAKAITKKIANYSYDISIFDEQKIIDIIKKHNVDGIYAGASEISIPVAIKLSSKLGLNYYCTEKQWEVCTNKRLFKEYCIKHDIAVSRVYSLDDVRKNDIQYPVVTKPVDNSGSTGIRICKNKFELENGIELALQNSIKKEILIEQYIPYDSAIVHYTAQNGKIVFSGISDKKSKTLSSVSAPIMAAQYFPAQSLNEYLNTTNSKAINMLEDIGVTDGPIWIETFVSDDNRYVFNEIGHRYGGSLTNYAVEFYTGINQTAILLNKCVGNTMYDNIESIQIRKDNYYIVPLHLCSGIIKKIEGIDLIRNNPYVHKVVMSHIENDKIEETGTVSQVFGYLHIKNIDINSLDALLNDILNVLKVFDENGNNMLFCLLKENNDETI